MSIIKTTEDGWSCVPELGEVVSIYEGVGSHIYEIKNCVRSEDLEQMIDELMGMCIDMKEKLEEIDESQEFETVEEEY
tara:strand:+ start:636 stop:869 length:234 start_codon:yes stop_codon:yes gene_type:complete